MNRPAAATLALTAIAIATTVTVAAVDNTETLPVAIGSGTSTPPLARIIGPVLLDDNGMALSVRGVTGGCASLTLRATQTATAVLLSLENTSTAAPSAHCPAVAVLGSARVRLSVPLGPRRVVDVSTNRSLVIKSSNSPWPNPRQ